ncbi:MAG TPA: hypothetical protein VML75_07775 [Kofleriaceae bacterium]|nr:hypothetical protein [Kofleriaceae bacterium]
MKSSIFRVVAVAVCLSATVAVATPRAEACGTYFFTEEDRVRSAVTSYLKGQQSFGGNARIEAAEVVNERVATARWTEPTDRGLYVTHVVLLKLDGRWQVIGTHRLAQSPAGSTLSSSPAEVANKR